MDFVISNVSTVEEDDEPLFSISKVTVVNDKKSPKEGKSPSPKYIKLCYVPLCPNSSRSTPEKMFITIPVNPARRKAWLDAVGKSSEGKNPKSPMFCCEDHFNLRKDMKNYEEHLRKGKVQMLLHQTVVPHIFVCNRFGHLKRNERLEVLKRIHAKKQHLKLLKDDDDESSTKKFSIKAAQSKTVFIEMPEFEYEDQPEYVKVKETDVETIIIDDSD